MSGARVSCVVCTKVDFGFKHFADAGWACRSCVLSADRVHVVHRIGGIRFVEVLKEASKEKTAVGAAAS